MLHRPPFLTKNDTIGIIAPARYVAPEVIENAKQIIESWGFSVKLGSHLFKRHHQFSASDSDRAADFNLMMKDPEVKAILCAGGGYGCIRTMNYLNKPTDPKWLCGFSDITIYHQWLHQQGWSTLHTTMPVKFDVHAPSTQSLKMALSGKLQKHQIADNKWNRNGTGHGEILGGNLSILYSMLGTSLDISYDGKILFIEEVDEYFYHIDRMLRSMKMAGKLDRLEGLIVGGFTDIHDNDTPFGKNIPEIIHDIFEGLTFPICFDFPAGHDHENRALYFGLNARMEVGQDGTTIGYQF